MSDTENRETAPASAAPGAASRDGAGPSASPAATVTATIDLTEEDIRAGLDDMSGSSPVRRAIGFGVVGACVLGYVIVQHDKQSVVTALPGVFVLAMFAYFTFLMRGRSARQQIETLRKAGDTLITYRFDEEGFVQRSAGASASIAYRRVVGTRLGKRTLLVFTGPRIAQLMPLRAFSADDLARVRAWLPANPPPQFSGNKKRILILWVVLIAAFFAIWQFLSPSESAAPKNHRRDARTPAGARRAP